MTAPFAPRAWRMLRHDIAPFLIVVLLLTVARSSFANHYVVPTGSMEYTVMPGDRVLVDMRAYGWRVPFTGIVFAGRAEPNRGDVVVFDSPLDGTRLIKRVAAIAGDRVSLRDGHLAIDGVALGDGGIERFDANEAHLNLDRGGGLDIEGLVVPPGHALVLGDHRGDSLDGRAYGLVPNDAFHGKAFAVYWRRGEGPTWQAL
ncbi:signal peptidase I [Dokdonella sp. MW10]|uniref:signal peptidase I n=1 Tax=Dokdonella sp. MW10 TaxID=2992926 RepID=UPI003F7E50EE